MLIQLGAKDDDVGDLFAAYMAERKDKPMGSSETHTSSNTDNKVDKDPQDEHEEPKKRWAPAQRLKRILSSGSGGGSNPSESNFVQPIPLEQPKSGKYNSSKATCSQSSTPSSLLGKEDIESINENLEMFTNDMQRKLDQLSFENPGSIPPNAKEILNEIVQRQRDLEMREKAEQRAVQSFGEYEERMRKQMENVKKNSENSIENNPVVKEIVEDAIKSNEFSEKRLQEMRNFQAYEEELKKQNSKGPSPMSIEPLVSASFEEQQLKILEDLLQRRNQAAEIGGFDDEDIYLTDNIEDGIDELREKIASSSSKKSYTQPESLKEWQMYRSIATKLANQKRGDNVNTDNGNDEYSTLLDQLSEDSDQIESKLQAWKEFERKEAEMREKSGLTIKYRPPFEWSDKPDVKNENPSLSRKRAPIDLVKAEEAKTELDDLALSVLTQLMDKTKDLTRKDKLRKEIEELKEGIEKRRYDLQNRGPEVTYKKKIVPISIKEALGSRNQKQSDKGNLAKVTERIREEFSGKNALNESTNVIDRNEGSEFANSGSNYDVSSPEFEVQPPDSDFFRESENDFALSIDEKVPYESDLGDKDIPSLGTIEQQKLRSLVARSGIRSVEGQKELQQKWEEFQAAEKEMREKAGLSVSTDSVSKTPVATPKVDYDVNAIFKEDGDIDFDKVLSSIGTRPSRKQIGKIRESTSPPASTVSTPQSQKYQYAETNIEDIPKNAEMHGNETENHGVKTGMSENSQEEGGRNEGTKEGIIENNNDAEGIQPSERGSLTFDFESNQVSGFDQRKALLIQNKKLSVSQVDNLIALKNSKYAAGVSPYLVKMNKPFKGYGAIFSLEGVLVDVTGFQYKVWTKVAEIYELTIPTVEDVQRASVHREEFAVQRVFYWTDDIFTARKIVETYRETRKALFQELMETSENQADNNESENTVSLGFDTADPVVTEDYTAIDCESDIVEIQHAAWEKAAKNYGYPPPPRDLLNIVGTMKPDEAVRVVFRWTKDLLISSDVGNAYRKYLKEGTLRWISKRDISVPRVLPNPQIALKVPESSQDDKQPFSPSLVDVLSLKQKAWEAAIEISKLHIIPPTLDEIKVVEYAGIERAPSVFQWNTTPENSSNLISGYQDQLRVLSRDWVSNMEGPLSQVEVDSKDEDSAIEMEPFLLKSGVRQWLSALEDIYVPCTVISHMEEELVDKILELMKLSDFFPKGSRISSNTGYDSETQQMLGAAVRLECRPDHCVVFSATPQSAAACHDVDMKNVAIVSPYPYYELTMSDMTVRDFGSIGVRNLRNIFSETTVEEPMEQIEVEGPQIRKETLLKTSFWDDDGR